MRLPLSVKLLLAAVGWVDENHKLEKRIRELEDERETLRDRLRSDSLCGVCGGFPDDHVSGLPCICGGTGKQRDEALNARKMVFELERKIDKALTVLDETSPCWCDEDVRDCWACRVRGALSRKVTP